MMIKQSARQFLLWLETRSQIIFATQLKKSTQVEQTAIQFMIAQGTGPENISNSFKKNAGVDTTVACVPEMSSLHGQSFICSLFAVV